jgi:hypothetical protein
MIIPGAVYIPEVTARNVVVRYEPTSIEARSQRIVKLLNERAKVFEQQVNAMDNGEKIPPQSERRWTDLTRQIDREYAG